MTQIHPRDSQWPEFEANSRGQTVSHGEFESLSSNKPQISFKRCFKPCYIPFEEQVYKPIYHDPQFLLKCGKVQ